MGLSRQETAEANAIFTECVKHSDLGKFSMLQGFGSWVHVIKRGVLVLAQAVSAGALLLLRSDC